MVRDITGKEKVLAKELEENKREKKDMRDSIPESAGNIQRPKQGWSAELKFHLHSYQVLIFVCVLN